MAERIKKGIWCVLLGATYALWDGDTGPPDFPINLKEGKQEAEARTLGRSFRALGRWGLRKGSPAASQQIYSVKPWRVGN